MRAVSKFLICPYPRQLKEYSFSLIRNLMLIRLGSETFTVDFVLPTDPCEIEKSMFLLSNFSINLRASMWQLSEKMIPVFSRLFLPLAQMLLHGLKPSFDKIVPNHDYLALEFFKLYRCKMKNDYPCLERYYSKHTPTLEVLDDFIIRRWIPMSSVLNYVRSSMIVKQYSQTKRRIEQRKNVKSKQKTKRRRTRLISINRKKKAKLMKINTV